MVDKVIKRIIIGVSIGVAIVAVLTVIVVVWSFTRSGKESSRKVDERRQEGVEFGRTTDQRGCINEGLKRGQNLKIIDIAGQVENQFFVEGCLQASRATPGFCDGVPSSFKDILTDWAEKQCEKIDVPSNICEGIIEEQIEFCER